MYCWFKQSCWSGMLIFVILLCAEHPGIGMCRPGVRMWVIWELANTVVVSTGPGLWFKNHIQTDIIVQLHLTHQGPRTCLSHTLTVTHKHSHKDSLFIPLKREWPRLSSNKGAGFTSGIRGGGESTLVDLRTVYLHWKPRRCETPTLRRCTNIEAICRGGFNSLQSNDWLFPLPSLQELRQWIS